MRWKVPPDIKVYEALGCIADGRIEVDGDSAKVYSSSRKKFYTVKYDSSKNAIMANDNGSYWVKYLGYPSIALLMVKGVLPSDGADVLKGVKWKDLNVAHKNDFEKTKEEVLSSVADPERLRHIVDDIMDRIAFLHLELLGRLVRPPSGY